METPVTDGLQALAAAALRAVTVYAGIARQLQGAQKELAIQLWQQQLETLHVLQGIYRLATGMHMNLKNEEMLLENIEPALRKNYTRCLKALAAYENRSADREFGTIFEALADREREHGRKIAELMGVMQV